MYKVYRLRYFRGGTQLSCDVSFFSRMNCCFQLKAPVRISRILPFSLLIKIVSNDSVEVEIKE